MILYCVRHGETEFNAVGRIQGQADSRLSELGKRQCEAIAQRLATQPIEAVYSSTLRRAIDSAQCIAQRLGLEVRIDPRLMEINAGIFQQLVWEQIEQRHPVEAAAWKSQDPDYRIPNGESRGDVMVRARAALEAIREASHRQAVIVAHGGLLSAALKVLLEIPAKLNPFSFYNGSISKLQWDGQVKLLTLNQIDHLRGLEGGGGDL